MFLKKCVLGIDLAMGEGEEKCVIHAGDYNLNYFAKCDRSLLQTVKSPFDIKPLNIHTDTRKTLLQLLSNL